MSKDTNEEMIREEPEDPCKNCPRAEWQELYGVMVYCCDMSSCIADDDLY